MVLGLCHDFFSMNEGRVGVNAGLCVTLTCAGYGPAAEEYSTLTLGGGGVYVGEVGFNDIAVDVLAICSEAERESNKA